MSKQIDLEKLRRDALCGAVASGTALDLIDLVAALEKDAARYRALREMHWCESSMCVVTNPKKAVKLGAFCPSGVNLDNEIDTAMEASNAKAD